MEKEKELPKKEESTKKEPKEIVVRIVHAEKAEKKDDEKDKTSEDSNTDN